MRIANDIGGGMVATFQPRAALTVSPALSTNPMNATGTPTARDASATPLSNAGTAEAVATPASNLSEEMDRGIIPRFRVQWRRKCGNRGPLSALFACHETSSISHRFRRNADGGRIRLPATGEN